MSYQPTQRIASRRNVLASLGILGVSVLAGCSSVTVAATSPSPRDENSSDSSEASHSSSSSSSSETSASPSPTSESTEDFAKYIKTMEPKFEDSPNYKPATKDTPPQNPPKPVLDPKYKEKTLEGAYQAALFAVATIDYMSDGGDESIYDQVIVPEDKKMQETKASNTMRRDPTRWAVGFKTTYDVRKMVVLLEDTPPAVLFHCVAKYPDFTVISKKDGETKEQKVAAKERSVRLVMVYLDGNWRLISNSYCQEKYPKIYAQGASGEKNSPESASTSSSGPV